MKGGEGRELRNRRGEMHVKIFICTEDAAVPMYSHCLCVVFV